MIVVALLLAGAAALADCEAMAATGGPQAAECYRQVARRHADPAVRAEALWAIGDVAGANAAFRDAAAAAPQDARVRARWGRLFLEVHQAADAEALFREALELAPELPEAHLGFAELSLGRFDPGVRDHAARVLEQVPDHPEAHLLLARLALELGEIEPVRRDLGRLLEQGVFQGASRLDAYAVLAAADALDEVSPSPWVERALAQHPRFGDVHAVPARYHVINRRYAEAVERYRAAVAIQPDHWQAHAELGINLLRLNEYARARRHLVTAYEGDPYNALTVNTLRLLDLLEGFASVEAPGLLIRAPAAHAPVLAPHVRRLARRAREEMSRRYGYQPEGPVVVELYEHHDDFAVRTAGLPGLGILGATFGDVVVMDGPAAKGIDEGFDWASALWHELAHVYTLGATGNRVSRWFSEGVSVMEEWDHGPSRHRSVPLTFLEALAGGRLLGVAELDEGFLRPRYPQQVAVSYVQAGLLCQLIAERFDGGIGRMLIAYRAGADTVTAVRQALGVEPAALDAVFRAALQERFGELLGELDELRQALRSAHEAAAAEDWLGAMRAGGRAVALYPDYVQSDSGYLPLARAAEARGERELLERTLIDYFAAGGRQPWALDALARLHRVSARPEQELAVRRALTRTVPLDIARRGVLADRHFALGRYRQAIDDYLAVLALGPHDEARVRLRLAESHLHLGRREQARRSLLEALEIAPGYDAALDLLLKLNGET